LHIVWIGIERMWMQTFGLYCGKLTLGPAGGKQKHAVEQEKYTYGGWWSVWWMGSYSMILSKAAFIHHKYFELYTHQMPASIHQYVREARYVGGLVYAVDMIAKFLNINFQSSSNPWETPLI
jgi:hypothetical protein